VRTANHIIESESRRVFKNHLPIHWVCRDKGDDYGIDCEVEIFNSSGKPTGAVFWVQLKGTASKNDAIIKSVAFKNEKLMQFGNYELPVLIVRYSDTDKHLFFRWAKSVCRFDKKGSTSIHFNDMDQWTYQTPNQIISYLKRYSTCRSGNVRFPIKVFVKKSLATATSQVPYSNLILIKNYLAGHSQYFTITSDEGDSSLQILVNDKQILFSFTDCAFSSLGLDFKKLSSEIDPKTEKFILLTLSSALFELGRADLGADVFFDNELFTEIKQVPVYLAHFLPQLLLGNCFTRTMQLVNQFLQEEHHDDNFIETVTNMALLVSRANLDDEQIILAEDFLLHNVEHSKQFGNPISLGAAYYNLANFYRGYNEYERALPYYVAAKKANPSYKNQAYYYQEVAGMLFLLDRYYTAASFYRKAMELDPQLKLARGLLADCLMYSGEYALAIDQLDIFLTETHQKDHDLDEWYLKFSCLKTLLLNGHPDKQTRDFDLGVSLCREGKFNDALDHDLLCPYAWFNKGVLANKIGETVNSFISFSMAGLIINHDVVAWTNATLLGINEDIDKNLLINVVKTAYFYNKQDYVNAVFNALHQASNEHRDKIMEALDKTIPKHMDKPMYIRFIGEDEPTVTVDLK
jgi:tetratricopeptide (TPR) repeat protein